MKSFVPKGEDDDGGDDEAPGSRNKERNYRSERRKNDTHASTTDSEARLYRKGKGKSAQLCFMGHALMENRHGLAVGSALTLATGTAEREATLAMLVSAPINSGATLGGDAAYDVWRFRQALKELDIVPHMARRTNKSWGGLPIPEPPGYLASQRSRKRIEEIFGWVKTIAGQAKTKFRGQARVEASFTLAIAA